MCPGFAGRCVDFAWLEHMQAHAITSKNRN